MEKTHYATIERATESHNTEYAGRTACGLEETESPCDDNYANVSCKNCLKVINKHNKEVEQASHIYF